MLFSSPYNDFYYITLPLTPLAIHRHLRVEGGLISDAVSFVTGSVVVAGGDFNCHAM